LQAFVHELVVLHNYSLWCCKMHHASNEHGYLRVLEPVLAELQ
jgi:hypothetical protein